MGNLPAALESALLASTAAIGGVGHRQLLSAMPLVPALLAMAAAALLRDVRSLACGLHMALLGLLVLGEGDALGGMSGGGHVWAMWHFASLVTGLFMASRLLDLHDSHPVLMRGLWGAVLPAPALLMVMLLWTPTLVDAVGQVLALMLNGFYLACAVLRRQRGTVTLATATWFVLAYVGYTVASLLQAVMIDGLYVAAALATAGTATLIGLLQPDHDRRVSRRPPTGRQHEGEMMLTLVAHELRAPLTRIDAAAQLISMQPTLSAVPHAEGELAKIRRTVRGMVDLVETLLSDDRLGAQISPPTGAPMNLGPFLRALCSTYARDVDRRVMLHISEEPVMVVADAPLLAVAIGNLLGNADRHSPPGASISVVVRVDGREVLVEVRDQGAGVPPDELARIFERHYRGRDSPMGLGLGLDIVRRVAALHGGTVSAATAAGGGALFTLRLPKAPPFRAGAQP